MILDGRNAGSDVDTLKSADCNSIGKLLILDGRNAGSDVDTLKCAEISLEN